MLSNHFLFFFSKNIVIYIFLYNHGLQYKVFNTYIQTIDKQSIGDKKLSTLLTNTPDKISKYKFDNVLLLCINNNISSRYIRYEVNDMIRFKKLYFTGEKVWEKNVRTKSNEL